MEQRNPVAPDLAFAATTAIQEAAHLQAYRECTSRALHTLSARCSGLDTQLRKQQPQTVKRVAGKVAVGLIAVMALLMQWPDHQLPKWFITGFQAIGDLEITNIWAPLEVTVEPQEFTPEERREYLRSIEARPTDEHTQFIWDSLNEEVKKGVADNQDQRQRARQALR